jgi:hypothetical protein
MKLPLRRQEIEMSQSAESKNKALVLEAYGDGFAA